MCERILKFAEPSLQCAYDGATQENRAAAVLGALFLALDAEEEGR
jgi:hypothetical protein